MTLFMRFEMMVGMIMRAMKLRLHIVSDVSYQKYNNFFVLINHTDLQYNICFQKYYYST